MGRRKKKKKVTIKSEETTTIFGILSLAVAIVLVASIFFHNKYFYKIQLFFGEGTLFASVLFLAFTLRMFGNKFKFNNAKALASFAVCILSVLGFVELFIYNGSSDENLLIKGGGELGLYTEKLFSRFLGYHGSLFILFTLTVFSLMIGLSISMKSFLMAIKSLINFIFSVFSEKIIPLISNMLRSMYRKYEERKIVRKNKPETKIKVKDSFKMSSDKVMMVGDLSGRNVLPVNSVMNERQPADVDPNSMIVSEHKPIISDEKFSNWRYPPLTLLNKPKPYVVQDENVKKNSDIIEKTLESFGILAKIADVKIGPVVTQYALQITMGTKVAKINNLNKDLALALAAPSGMVRVEAPIPGTSLIGIEMPNMHPHTVSIREILESNEMAKEIMLPLAIGRDVSGTIVVRDLQKMPHLLIAGSTGSGKSVAVNSFIISMLFKYSPNELKFIMVDPKQVELSQYNGIPHLLVPVITDMEKVVNALKWAVVEMETRYKRFKEVQVRNIEQYNKKSDVISIPYIVIIIDEMADLMMLQGIEVESSIVRLAQMARAVGIHLILATQRPSVNVITGLIKANVPARIGMSVTSVIDSRVILDTGGAETLLGKGDMLFKQPDSIRPLRVQGVMVNDEEIIKVIDFIKQQTPEVEYTSEITDFQSNENKRSVGGGWEDSMFPDAVRVVVNAGRGSASILQSKLRIGYARAARLIEELEQRGVVSPQDGSKPRDVLITDAEIFLGQKTDNENSR